MTSNNLLVLHENRREINSLADFLSINGFKISKVSTETELAHKIETIQPDLIMLPVETSSPKGIELCQLIKSKQNTKNIFVVLLSNKKEEETQIKGLEAGADDFLVQPVPRRVLLSRLKALLKRKKWKSLDTSSEIFLIDEERYLIIRNGVEFYLPKKEFEILSLLYSKPNKVFTRDEIKNSLWENFERVRGRTIDVHIRKIREKIGEDIIITVKGIGYRLELA